MTKTQLIEYFSQLLSELLFDDSIRLTSETTRDQVPNWDSFAYVNFIAIVEMKLNVKFSVSDVEAFANVGAIADRVLKELEKSGHRK